MTSIAYVHKCQKQPPVAAGVSGQDLQTRQVVNGAPNFKCMTLNSNGLHTRYPNGRQKINKASAICMHSRAENIDIIGLPKPHVHADDHVTVVANVFSTSFYHFICPHNSGQRGGSLGNPSGMD